MENSLERDAKINEIYDLQHRHDNELHNATEYKTKSLSKSLSNVMFSNDITSNFINMLQRNVSLMITSNTIIRNWLNWTVSKYYDRHNN
jgi:hypothetical protein